jgi:hypothetical protein
MGFGEALVWFSLMVAAYFLPAMVAGFRGHQHVWPIFWLNLFLGWTLIGWVAALVWCAMPVKPASSRAVAS